MDKELCNAVGMNKADRKDVRTAKNAKKRKGGLKIKTRSNLLSKESNGWGFRNTAHKHKEVINAEGTPEVIEVPVSTPILTVRDIKIMSAMSSVGFLAGLGLAYKKKSSFWGYVGFGLLGSIVGSASGKVIGIVTEK